MFLLRRVNHIFLLIPFVVFLFIGCEEVERKGENLLDNTIKPSITLVGYPTITLIQGSIYIDAGAIAHDDIDGDITVDIVVSNPVDINTIGIYGVTYDVTDSSGNNAIQIVRTVKVVVLSSTPIPPPTPLVTPKPTPIPTLLVTSNPTPVPTPFITPKLTAVATPLVTLNPTPVPTPFITPKLTAVPTPLVTLNPTPIPIPLVTPKPTPVPTPLVTPTPTPVPTPLVTPTPTPVPTPSATSKPTPIPTPLATSKPTPVPTPTPINKYPHLPKNITNDIAINFLSLSTFGATKISREALEQKGIELWIDEQFTLPYKEKMHLKRTISLTKQTQPTENTATIKEYLAENDTVFNLSIASFKVNRYQMSAWFETALFDEDQLRHRVAYALSQIIVESLAEPLFIRRAEALATHMDTLTKHSFGNYKELLLEVSHSASMGLYLTYNGSKKEQQVGTTTIYPDENYAREIMQLFTIGLDMLNLDGTAKLDSNGNTIPTYTQTDVNELSKVFTGWDLQKNDRFGQVFFKKGDLTKPLEFTPEHHDFGAKNILGQTIEAGNDGTEDISSAIDILMAHPNVAPFISKQLIMRLVKSNPTPAYVSRVAMVFNDNGAGVKGDLNAVVKAIYLDKELWESSDIKKFKEPLLAYTQFLRAFKIEPMPVWRTSKTATVDIHNRIYMLDPTAFLGQGVTRAFTVFNFYSNQYIPNDTVFKQEKLSAPELQIQADAMLISYANKIGDILWRRGKRAVINKFGDIHNIDELISNNYNIVYNAGQEKFLLDFSDEYAIIEKELEGVVDGHFESLNGLIRHNDTSADEKGITNSDRGLKALIEHLDLKLTGGRLKEEQKDTLFKGYKETFYYAQIKNATDPEQKIYEHIIVKVIQHIIISETYMVQ